MSSPKPEARLSEHRMQRTMSGLAELRATGCRMSASIRTLEKRPWTQMRQDGATASPPNTSSVSCKSEIKLELLCELGGKLNSLLLPHVGLDCQLIPELKAETLPRVSHRLGGVRKRHS